MRYIVHGPSVTDRAHKRSVHTRTLYVISRALFLPWNMELFFARAAQVLNSISANYECSSWWVMTCFNPIWTRLFESKFLLGGGGTPPKKSDPPSDLGAGNDREQVKIWADQRYCMDVKTHVKSIAGRQFFFGRKRFIILSHCGIPPVFMQIRCILSCISINISNK